MHELTVSKGLKILLNMLKKLLIAIIHLPFLLTKAFVYKASKLVSHTNLQATETDRSEHKVCIIGGGFGGLYTALKLSQKMDNNCKIYLIDPKERFSFSPLLYELAVGSASSVEVAPKYSDLLAGDSKIKFIQGYVKNVDFNGKSCAINTVNNVNVNLNNQETSLNFDQLVISAGIQPRIDLIPGAKEHSLPFYQLADAYALRNKLRSLKPTMDKKKVNVAIIGGGYSGVELATNVAQYFGRSKCQVTLIDRHNKLMAASTEFNRKTAERTIANYGVEVKYNTTVKEVLPNKLQLIDLANNNREYELSTDLVLFTAGTEQSAFVRSLADLQKDQFGRIKVNSYLQSIDYPNVFALGDCAVMVDEEPIPATAQVALQQSGTVARNVYQQYRTSRSNSKPEEFEKFEFLSLGEMLTLGDHNGAITSLNGLVKMNGALASLGRRVVYAARMPTVKQSVKAFTTASTVTLGKLLGRKK